MQYEKHQSAPLNLKNDTRQFEIDFSVYDYLGILSELYLMELLIVPVSIYLLILF